MFRLLICCILFSGFQTNFAFPNDYNNSALLIQEDSNSTLLQVGDSIGEKCCCCDDRKTCGASIGSKTSYFVNPNNFQQDCPLKIKIYSRDVCQIRLDFEEFDIYQPTNNQNPDYLNEENNGNAYKCYVDRFRVEKAPRNLGFTSLCGKNNGQHIYIPVEKGQSEVVLRFLLRTRTSNMLSQNPRWKIKIRQLECSSRSDSKLIAPSNCLQYYQEYQNVFESFNYNDGRGCYIGGLDYSVCFKNSPDICSVTYYSPNKFQMNYNEDISDDRCRPNKRAAECVSHDYIRINEGKISNGQYKEYFCGQDFSNFQRVTSKTNGPLYVKIHTDDYRAYEVEPCNQNPEEHAEIGFRLNYELEYCYY